MKTAQEVFDHVVNHLFTQGVAAYDNIGQSGNGCCYRTGDGRSCAVGCLIPDDQYNKSMEGMSVHNLIGGAERRGYTVPAVVIEHKGMLSDLQSVHDTYMPRRRRDDTPSYDEDINLTSERLQRLAEAYGLKYTKPEQVNAD